MNDLIEKIRPFIKEEIIKTDSPLSLKSITTNIQKSTVNDIVFYRLFDNDTSKKNFKKRISNQNPGLIVTNIKCDELEAHHSIIVSENDFLKCQKILCDELYPISGKLILSGVTGTNGKTTVVSLAKQIALQYGKKALSLGTLGLTDQSEKIIIDLDSTTPSYSELRKVIHQIQDEYDILFFEVSSHALDQDRLYDLKLSSVGFTSFSQDHLDYHKTEEAYFQAKMKIVDKSDAILNIPSNERELLKKAGTQAQACSVKTKNLPLELSVQHNYSNLEVAYALNQDLWGGRDIDFSKLKLPKGRFNTIEFGDTHFVIDYAHTPDGISKICEAVKKQFNDHTLIVVFGCGGDRDKSKRPLMGRAASSFADYSIITSDNPRTEKPELIIEDIIPGMIGDFEKCTDRSKAIALAFERAKGKSIIIIAGKGHEEYQDIGGTKVDYSDFKVVEDLISKRNK